MKLRKASVAVVGLALLALREVGAQAPKSQGAADAHEQLERHRNLGKAFYENPTTQLQAVGEFKKALELAPDSARERLNYGLALLRAGKTAEGAAELALVQKQEPALPHSWFNLGMVFKKDSAFDKAIVQFEKMAQLVPTEAITHYNLGVLYKLTGKPEAALASFEMSTKLNPNLAGPHFQLFNAYRVAGRAEEAAREEKLFYALKKLKAGAAVPEDLEWSFYAEIHDPIQQVEAPAAGSPIAVSFESRKLGTGFSGIVAADVDGDAKADLVAWGPAGVSVVHGPPMSGLEAEKGVASVAPADFDNDGLADLCVVTNTGVKLLVSRKARFEAGPSLGGVKAGVQSAVWLDYDHDYDLDLFLLGPQPALFRNNGAAGFSDETANFPFVSGKALTGVAFDLIPDTDGFDLVVAYEDRTGVLYRDLLGGKYGAADITALPAGKGQLLARDFDNDGYTDLAYGSQIVLNREGNLSQASGGKPMAAAFADLENRGFAELVTADGVYRNLGLGKAALQGMKLAQSLWLTAGDFDADGREDVAAVTVTGEGQLWLNKTEEARGWSRIVLTGVKNQKLSNGAEVEVKAGPSYQKQTYRGVPLHFGLRSHSEIDTVRVTWANGLVQNEVRKAASKELAVKEAPRLSGSCPMIFTWNGKEHQFITDVLAVAPLGAAAADGKYFPVDHDEYIQIPAGALAARGGRYDVRITEELREVSYIDQVKLLAVDHPAGSQLFTNDKFKGEPFPDFRLFAVQQRVYPLRAKDDRGRDVRAALMAKDRVYVDTFTRRMTGAAELHALELDFGKGTSTQAALVMSGWVDWPDGSTFRSVSQERPAGFTMPYLQVEDADGRWRTVVTDMGMPAGKPKAIVVDLSGLFLSSSRKVRIVTDLCLYWDEIFLSEDANTAPIRMHAASPATGVLDYRGFSTVTVHPERRQPDEFAYFPVTAAKTWNPIPGMYTRFGDVRELVSGIDDRLVVMGAGDELRLTFEASAFPTLGPGMTRSLLLFVDGWAKDGDANTAFGTTVEPLPFHGMSAYPYGTSERFPDTEFHRQYQREFNTRPALRLLTTLRPDQGRTKNNAND